ncbi:TPA: hypothetical protein U5E00_004491 [Yersinia enterocolitica]|nr:hypothetical protein [Yersinia enterocolitica]EKN3942734.1 hypothetical protein [Yersinia enterocolitica]UYK06559.1 hypothetical protein N4218_01555 [Yersinia enterocolitica]CNJ74733.1 Uncharacterised protein [Yersinia enterocolitica]HDL6527632.1 hypothetical protein [Yersinia enterocolitica]HDL6731019.1 hypothetical protein [Yersinia enterocolitica]
METVFSVNNKKVPLKSLRYKSKATQLEVMRNWFFDNYEDPVNSCPYESREGGYAYIYGGPYDADEELQEMFGAHISFDYIQELVSELQDVCFDWSGNSNNIDGWYDEDLYDAVTSSEDPYNNFAENIDKIKSLAVVECRDEQKDHLLGILYTNVITGLETLYVELFTNSIEKDESYIVNCIENGNTNFKVSKTMTAMPFKEESIENLRNELVKEIKEHLISASWHNTNQVIKRYRSTFGINVQSEWPIEAIDEATKIRNHLVHRGGKDKEGNPVVITPQDLEQLLDHAMLLGKKLYISLNNAIQDKVNFSESEF